MAHIVTLRILIDEPDEARVYDVSDQPSHSTRSKIYGNAAFNGSNASIRLLGQVDNFSRVSFSQAWGSKPLSDDRRL